MMQWLWLVLVPGMLLPITPSWALEKAGMGMSAREQAQTVPAGVWQLNCELFRSDLPNARTLGATRMMYLAIIHDAGAPTAEVDWAAERGFCWGDEPCDLMKTRGQALAHVTGAGGNELVMALEFPPELNLRPAFMSLRKNSASKGLSGLAYFTEDGGRVQRFEASCTR